MTNVSAAQVKELREKTGAGMMDAKNALVDCEGDMEAAQDWLRKKGLSQAQKKSSRATAEGLVATHTDGKTGAIVEVNAETDFVARNENFQEFVGQVVKLATGVNELEELKNRDYGQGKSVADALTDLIATVGENMQLRRMKRYDVDNGVVCSYVHSPIAPGLGTIGVLVALESEGDTAKLEELGRKLAMHIAAAYPNFVSTEDVDQATLEKEKNFQREQARESGKPEDIIEKMIEGRMRKFYEEICLLEQTYVIDNETKVADVLKNAEAEVGAPVRIAAFERFQLGEGMESGEGEDSQDDVA
jgi:elongation factor Ts